VEIRYYIDPETDEPHIYSHGIGEREVEQVLHGSGDDVPGANRSRIKLGQAYNGRYLKIVYVPDEFDDSVFVITAYELRGKEKTAFRRRRRRKPK
jgi:hypothetical protein